MCQGRGSKRLRVNIIPVKLKYGMYCVIKQSWDEKPTLRPPTWAMHQRCSTQVMPQMGWRDGLPPNELILLMVVNRTHQKIYNMYVCVPGQVEQLIEEIVQCSVIIVSMNYVVDVNSKPIIYIKNNLPTWSCYK